MAIVVSDSESDDGSTCVVITAHTSSKFASVFAADRCEEFDAAGPIDSGAAATSSASGIVAGEFTLEELDPDRPIDSGAARTSSASVVAADSRTLGELDSDRESMDLEACPGSSSRIDVVKRKWPAHVLPDFGFLVQGVVASFSAPLLPATAPLNIKLSMEGLEPVPQQACWAQQLGQSEQHVAKYYGTPRPFPATHYTSGVLTTRNKHELPQCLFFDPEHLAFLAQSAERDRLRSGDGVLPKSRRMAVSPVFAEWIMGLPRGWTSLDPVMAADVRNHDIRKLRGHDDRHPVISLFSGIGALDFALSQWCRAVAYCDIDVYARAVIMARQNDGSLDSAAFFDDVASISAESLPRASVLNAKDHLGILMGFPCTDLSLAGKMAGLCGPNSKLVFDGLRVAEELRADFIFMENVAHIRARGLATLLEEMGSCGWRCRWCELCANQVGSPQRRKRWFLLAWRGDFRPELFAGDGFGFVSGGGGKQFNGGRPEVDHWMTDMAAYPENKARLCAAGNAVVPLQAAVAAQVLSAGNL